jgi:hypothetical protein
MGIVPKLTLFSLIFILVSACSKQQGSPRNLAVSVLNLGSSQFAGGALVRIENLADGTITESELTEAPYTVSLKDGNWNIYFVGFAGPSQWQGASYCGGAEGINLTPATLEVNITANLTNCSSEPYSTMIAGKTSTWDQAIWDQSTWGP